MASAAQRGGSWWARLRSCQCGESGEAEQLGPPVPTEGTQNDKFQNKFKGEVKRSSERMWDYS